MCGVRARSSSATILRPEEGRGERPHLLLGLRPDDLGVSGVFLDRSRSPHCAPCAGGELATRRHGPSKLVRQAKPLCRPRTYRAPPPARTRA